MKKTITLFHLRKIATLGTLRALLLLGLFWLAAGRQATAQTYCSPTFDNGCGSWYLSNIQVGGLNWSLGSSDCSVSDYTSLSASVTAGALTPMTVSGTMWNGVSVYVDFNNDGDFDDAGEYLFGTYPNQSSWTENFNITVPAYVPTGSYRMRVIGPWGSGGGAGQACAEFQYGGFYDFTLNVTNNNTCYPPSGITVSNIQPTQADINWTASTTSPTGYIYEVVAAGAGSNGTQVSVGNVASTATTATATGLSANTSYDLYISSSCSGPDTSLWYGPINFNTLLAACAGTPTVSAITASQTTGCSEYISNLSIDTATASGITFQWRSSTDGVTYTTLIGATGTTYAADVTQNVYYEVVATCTSVGGGSDTSAAIELLYTAPAPVIASLPYSESFENWFGTCYSFDRPDSSITLNPTYTSDAWRRDDQGTDANWTDPTFYMYSPASTVGAHSARFHSGYDGPGAIEGDMDLHINLSPAGIKQISFDYNNQDGNDYLMIELSEDGTTWDTLQTYYPTNDGGWQHEVFTITSVAPNAIIRIAGVSDYGGTDIGVDNFNVVVLVPCSGTPDPGTVSATQTSGCSEYFPVLTSSAGNSISGLTYQWQSSTDNSTWTNLSNATNSTYTADVTANVYYRVVVTCTASTTSANSPSINLLYVTPTASYATLPYFQGFENWMGTCYNYDRPDTSWILTPVYGDASWRRDDQGSDAGWDYPNDGTYTPASNEGAHSARFHTSEGGDDNNESGTMDLYVNMTATGTKLITFDYLNNCTNNGYDLSSLTVSISTDGINFTQLGQYGNNITNWTQEILTTNIVGNAIIRFQGNTDYSYGDLGIDSVNVTLLPACTGTPVAGVITSTQLSGCSEYTPTLSLNVDYSIGGLAYKWESSTDGTTWTDVPGATNTSYLADVTASIYYRAVVTCTNSNDSDITTPVQLMYVTPVAAIATVPYFQSFESWMGTCYNYDRPDSSWILNPVYGNASWRRDDQGTDANWTFPTDYMYSPASTDGVHSARFHSGYTSPAGTEGDMDLHIDLSTPGTKEIAFDYINGDGTDYMNVELSEDGGATFPTTLATVNVYSSNWLPQHITTTSVSPTAVIRFAAISDYGGTDIGVDSVSVSVLPACAGMPVAGTFSNTQTSGCTPYTDILSVNTPIYATGISYQWQMSTDGTTWTDVSGATALTYTASVNANIYYRFYVVCATSNDTDTSASTELTYTPEVVTTATLPYFQSFESWIGNCTLYDRPDSNWVQPFNTSGNASWRRDDQGNDASWTSPTLSAYIPTSTDGAHSARFHRARAGFNNGEMDLHIDLSAPGLKQLNFDCMNSSGADLTVSLSEDGGQTFNPIGDAANPNDDQGVWLPQSFIFNSVSPTAIIRFTAIGAFTTFGTYLDIGMDSLDLFIVPSCTGTPTAGTFTSSQTSGCTAYIPNLSVDAPIQLSNISYQWQTSTDGVTYTNISGATGTTYSGFVGGTVYYRFYVKCGASGDSDISAATEYTMVPEVTGTASLPYFQGFENWIGTCTLYDRPDSNWVTTPNTGNASWRRDDQGTDAGWSDGGADGSYYPTSTELDHSARFHSYDVGYGDEGDLDLHINLSNPGSKTILFDYNNDDGDDYLNVELSEDGGNTFTTLNTYNSGDYTGLTGWNPVSLTTTSVAANAIIRFAGISDDGYTDIGIDSLSIAGPACDTITGLAINGINQTGATASWTAVGGTAGYEVVVDQSSGAPTGTILNTGNTSDVITGLLSGTTYYVHVRDSCGPGAVSTWTTIAFNTTTCDTVTNLAVTGITMTGATANWTAVSGTAGYEVTLDQSPTSPSVVGTSTGTNSYNAISLLPGTTYYVHVRDSCGPGSYSAWTTISFTTLACDSITGLSVTGVSDHGATISWNAVPGTSGYEYVVGTNSSTPVAGSGTSNTSVTESTLNASTVYYVFVRDSCGPNTFSAWDTLSFTTYNLGIGAINGSQFNVDAYPNPASDIITVRVYGVKGDNRKVSLTDVAGRTISTVDMASDRVDFNMANLASGIYLIRYEDDAHTRVIKVNKQ